MDGCEHALATISVQPQCSTSSQIMGPTRWREVIQKISLSECQTTCCIKNETNMIRNYNNKNIKEVRYAELIGLLKMWLFAGLVMNSCSVYSVLI